MENTEEVYTLGPFAGVTLAAATRIIQGLREHPGPLTVERLAAVLDEALNFEWAIRLLTILYEDDMFTETVCSDGLRDFHSWVFRNLMFTPPADADNVHASQ